MVNPSQGAVANGRLDSWKDIAGYLRRDVRTAIRWEKEKGLPVRRVPGGQRQAVFAYITELDAWLRQEDAAAIPHGLKPNSSGQAYGTTEVVPFPDTAAEPNAGHSGLRYYYLIAAAVACVLVFAVFGYRWRAAPVSFPVRVGFTLNAVQAFDGANQLLWTHTFQGLLQPKPIDGARASDFAYFSYIGDFRGKGDHEVLVIVPFDPGLNAAEPTRTEVDLFSSRGKLLWSYVPLGRFQFGKHELDGPWVGTALFVSSRGERKQIWVAIGHAVWGNSFVVSLDPGTGQDTLRFVNTGSIHVLNELRTAQGDFLLAGGFNNEPDTGSLAVVNEAKAFAASPQSAGTRHKCVSCTAGDVDYYFEFPRSEINELEQMHEDAVVALSVKDEQIELRKKESNGGLQTLYLLRADRGVRAVSVRFDSTYDMLHRKLEGEGKVDHTLETCPERLHPRPIRMWTPAGGWTEIRLESDRASE